jgi:RimJ/RimL family protein N-acetyltransferase
MLESPCLCEHTDDLLKLIAEKVRIEKDFRIKIGGSSLLPDIQKEFLYWKQYAQDPNKLIVLAWSGSRFIGFFALDEINHAAKNARSHVHFWAQSKTLPMLCDTFLKYCKNELGLKNLWGMTSTGNPTAINFALKIGFEKMGELPEFYATESGTFNAMLSNFNLGKL